MRENELRHWSLSTTTNERDNSPLSSSLVGRRIREDRAGFDDVVGFRCSRSSLSPRDLQVVVPQRLEVEGEAEAAGLGLEVVLFLSLGAMALPQGCVRREVVLKGFARPRGQRKDLRLVFRRLPLAVFAPLEVRDDALVSGLFRRDLGGDGASSEILLAFVVSVRRIRFQDQQHLAGRAVHPEAPQGRRVVGPRFFLRSVESRPLGQMPRAPIAPAVEGQLEPNDAVALELVPPLVPHELLQGPLLRVPRRRNVKVVRLGRA
mmetsp:Transcript_7042/g.23075  ORF Transcript_7042/g.23075 Transcript_7042/m.23075 type:complete len:262 (+) Transcript_7042:652-1437(+)